MTDLTSRLVGCFTSVFPDLPAEAAHEATAGSVRAWDSLATVTLVKVIEEEFGITVDVADIPDLTSFGCILEYVRSKPPGGA
jgi:acyl carrier protein